MHHDALDMCCQYIFLNMLGGYQQRKANQEMEADLETGPDRKTESELA